MRRTDEEFTPTTDGPRRALGLAPTRCITVEHCVSPDHVLLVGRDLEGTVRVKVELARTDATSWWGGVLRFWLAWKYGASELHLMGRDE